MIYWRRFPVARLALPLALALVTIEHGTANGLGTIFILFGAPPPWAQLVLTLTLHGALSSLLFVTGVAAIAVLETRLRLPTRPVKCTPSPWLRAGQRA
jgi:hypothetical protein